MRRRPRRRPQLVPQLKAEKKVRVVTRGRARVTKAVKARAKERNRLLESRRSEEGGGAAARKTPRSRRGTEVGAERTTAAGRRAGGRNGRLPKTQSAAPRMLGPPRRTMAPARVPGSSPSVPSARRRGHRRPCLRRVSGARGRRASAARGMPLFLATGRCPVSGILIRPRTFHCRDALAAGRRVLHQLHRRGSSPVRHPIGTDHRQAGWALHLANHGASAETAPAPAAAKTMSAHRQAAAATAVPRSASACHAAVAAADVVGGDLTTPGFGGGGGSGRLGTTGEEVAMFRHFRVLALPVNRWRTGC
mmetsp:Transcript_173904/g.557394  ORF Transcript_173904/g.557394 Transcript_173904/m.557394 type:complete len:306 (+) Transcript_173904:398-1315(+)